MKVIFRRKGHKDQEFQYSEGTTMYFPELEKYNYTVEQSAGLTIYHIGKKKKLHKVGPASKALRKEVDKAWEAAQRPANPKWKEQNTLNFACFNCGSGMARLEPSKKEELIEAVKELEELMDDDAVAMGVSKMEVLRLINKIL